MPVAQDIGEKLLLLAPKTVAESDVSQLVPLDSVHVMLQIQYRGAELKLPAGVDIDVIVAPLRSLQIL